MTTSGNPVLLALILIVVVVIAVAQIAFFIWVARHMKKHAAPTTPAQFNFICKIIAGVCLLAAAGFAIYSTILLTTGAKTAGTISELREKRDEDDGRTIFAPTFTFVDASGHTNVVASNLYSSSNRYRIGDQVPVVYRKSNPTSARIDRFAENWFAPTLLSAFGLAALVSMPIYKKWHELRARPEPHPSTTSTGAA